MTMPCDWFKNLEPLFHPIRSISKAISESLIHIFPRFVQVTCIFVELSLVHWVFSVLFGEQNVFFGLVLSHLIEKKLYLMEV